MTYDEIMELLTDYGYEPEAEMVDMIEVACEDGRRKGYKQGHEVGYELGVNHGHETGFKRGLREAR